MYGKTSFPITGCIFVNIQKNFWMVDGEQNGGKKIFRAVQFFPTTFGTTNQ
jgi:hypothetical protein